MTAVSEVIWTLRCDYPDCPREFGSFSDPTTLRGDAASEAEWTTDGRSDYCFQHRAPWEEQHYG